jgi:energy-coupling factor transporter ATP-binding protein EcfA2
MSIWETYPANYRNTEIQAILSAIRSGECVSVVGLSGAGKSNLLGFMASRVNGDPPLALVDCNRLAEPSADAFYRLASHALGGEDKSADALAALEAAVEAQLAKAAGRLGLLFDRFDALPEMIARPVYGNLRALRDANKYQLTYVTATRRPLDSSSELAELFYANTLWLGPLSESDARWSAVRFCERKGLAWDDETISQLLEVTWCYPSLLRAACEAHASGASLDIQALSEHPAMRQRVSEFFADGPSLEALRASRLEGQPLLARQQPEVIDTSALTAKEMLLLAYLQAHGNEVCDKDELIKAVWPEDKIFEEGIRDDSLAQLVRRLRIKIEPDPSNPRYIHVVAGRGYRYTG